MKRKNATRFGSSKAAETLANSPKPANVAGGGAPKLPNDVPLESRLNDLLKRGLAQKRSTENPDDSSSIAAGDTVTILLTTALQSGDKTKIDSALKQCHDQPTLIRRTVTELPVECVLLLIDEIEKRLRTVKVILPYTDWLQIILDEHESYLTSLPHLRARLHSLDTYIQSRLEYDAELAELKKRVATLEAHVKGEARAHHADVPDREVHPRIAATSAAADDIDSSVSGDDDHDDANMDVGGSAEKWWTKEQGGNVVDAGDVGDDKSDTASSSDAELSSLESLSGLTRTATTKKQRRSATQNAAENSESGDSDAEDLSPLTTGLGVDEDEDSGSENDLPVAAGDDDED